MRGNAGGDENAAKGKPGIPTTWMSWLLGSDGNICNYPVGDV
jgi:hypothetical protein